MFQRTFKWKVSLSYYIPVEMCRIRSANSLGCSVRRECESTGRDGTVKMSCSPVVEGGSQAFILSADVRHDSSPRETETFVTRKDILDVQ